MWPARPKSRVQRILQDLRQLWRDCVCGYRVTQTSASESNPRGIHESGAATVKKHQERSQNGDIFERAADKGSKYAKSLLPSLDGRLRREAFSLPDSGLRCESPPRSNSHTLDDESSKTAQEASIHSDPPANIRARPKNAFQRWKAMRPGAARKNSRIRREGSNE